MMTEELPKHLRKYVVKQEERAYTPIDHAVWRFCLRQLRAYLAHNAHESYLDGLEKTGIEIERIPRISDISEKLSRFGWRALPVSGFIPPAAFMELQSLNVLPIASDVRTADHLTYTPAPDIVHEAAGHAPMLAHPEFAAYLRNYAQVASKALISREDIEVYEAIRDLSDLKENPGSTTVDIARAENRLEEMTGKTSHVSEATWLSRMNWWTAEYGLIGSLEHPKIFGAGLLSSVGESKWCLSKKVKKIPLSVDCINYTYDITEPQPHLFVTPDFPTLNKVLEDLAEKMAFRRGGLESIHKAILADTVNTVELDSGIQIGGRCVEVVTDDDGELAFLRFDGPSQLAFGHKELPGHDKNHHAHGYSTPLGALRKFPGKNPALLTDEEWKSLGAVEGGAITLEYVSGIKVTGRCQQRLCRNGKTLVLSLVDAKAQWKNRVLFEPEWGVYDIVFGLATPSVYGGPPDHEAYGELDSFVAARVPAPKYSERELRQHQHYAAVRAWRENKTSGKAMEEELTALFHAHRREFPQDWLLILEMYELSLNRLPYSPLTTELQTTLNALAKSQKAGADVIQDGIHLAGTI
ncbi:MAG: aromatic amino acid hydroxylase [Bdellovibrionaceae bacterium]|nr:aromatic amino acid hydroxylase [Pseudobdellovibrionaceae bacterium]